MALWWYNRTRAPGVPSDPDARRRFEHSTIHTDPYIVPGMRGFWARFAPDRTSSSTRYPIL